MSAPSPREVISVAAAMIAGHLGPISQPYQLGVIMEAGGSDAVSAGLFIATEIALYSLTLMVAARFVGRLDLRRMAFAGVLISLVSLVFTGLVIGSSLMYLGAAMVGVGQGLIFGASIAAAARSQEPEKVFGLAGMITLIVFAGFMAITPVLQGMFGATVLFRELAAMVAIFALGLVWLPTQGLPDASARMTFRDTRVITFLALIALYGVATGGVYAFMERMGHAIGLSARENGLILMIGILFGAAGSAVAGRMGLAYGRLMPLCVSIIAIGVASLGIGAARGALIFTLATILYQIFYSYAYPYLVGTAAWLESSGSLASFTGGFIFLTSSLGAALAGVVVERASFATLGIVALVACVLAALLVPKSLLPARPT